MKEVNELKENPFRSPGTHRVKTKVLDVGETAEVQSLVQAREDVERSWLVF